MASFNRFRDPSAASQSARLDAARVLSAEQTQIKLMVEAAECLRLAIVEWERADAADDTWREFLELVELEPGDFDQVDEIVGNDLARAAQKVREAFHELRMLEAQWTP